jgi:sigma-B regulation protein RsbU (phosphoserine phosphatase)
MTAPIRVLIVDDERDVREVISDILEALGHQVECAENGQIGVEKVQSWHPDIVVLDVRMPVMTGPEAAIVLRSKPETANLPIFILTAHTDSKTLADCESAGVNRIFSKPPDFMEIDAAIRQAVQRNGAEMA